MAYIFEPMNALTDKTWHGGLDILYSREYIQKINAENQKDDGDDKT